MAWGKGSCDALLKRLEDNDPKLRDLVILPMKTFGPAEVERLSRAIASGANTNLQSISASGHHLPPESLKQLGLAISTQAKKQFQTNDENKCGITSLAIGSKDMGDEGLIALCEGLEESSGGLLQSLDFGWKNLGKDGLQAIARTFASSQSLKHIDLSRNDHTGSEGIICMANAAKESTDNGEVVFPSLETMILSECNIDSSGVPSLADMILGPNNNRPKPIHLAISSNPIGSESCVALSKLFTFPDKGSSVSHLQLSQCSIGDEGIKLLSTAAISNSCIGLKILDLSENSISEDGAKGFAESLAESWPDLAELKLAKNELGSEGVISVMGALVARSDETTNESPGDKNSTVQNLDLTCTNCGAEGARAALMSGSLTTLRLFNNRLGSDGFRSISPLLRGGHPSIENLDLGGNDAEEEAVTALLNAIADTEGKVVGSKLAVLEIGGNKFGEKSMEALNELKLAWPRLDVAHDKPVQEADDQEADEIDSTNE